MTEQQAFYEQLSANTASLSARGVNVEAMKSALKAQHIKTPFWGIEVVLA